MNHKGLFLIKLVNYNEMLKENINKYRNIILKIWKPVNTN